MKKMERSTYIGFGLFFGVLLVGLFLTQGNGVSTNVVRGGPGQLVEINTVIQGFQYSPDTVTVKKGSKVKLTIQNKDNVLHGLHLPQFGINGATPALSTKTVEFTAIETPTNGQAVPTCSQEHGEKLIFNIV